MESLAAVTPSGATELDDLTEVAPGPSHAHSTGSHTIDPLDSTPLDDVTTLTGPEKAIALGPGTQLGDYELEQIIAEGGMGEVYAAVHPLIGKRAAIKVLKKSLCADSLIVQRFIDEARAVNQIGHPNIVDVFAFGETSDGRSYLAMEWLGGESLRDRITRERLELREACRIVRELARALEAAHDKGVIHRDLKPDNVQLVEVRGEPPRVKLLDFGIAKLVHETNRLDSTAKGALVGTPQYMAPEQARAMTIGGAADVYSLGCLAFELITGRPPFFADNHAEMLAKHVSEKPHRLGAYVAVPPELEQLVAHMLAKRPEARPSLAEIEAVVERIEVGRTTYARASTPVPVETGVVSSLIARAPRWSIAWSLALLAALAVLGAALAGFMLVRSVSSSLDSTPSTSPAPASPVETAPPPTPTQPPAPQPPTEPAPAVLPPVTQEEPVVPPPRKRPAKPTEPASAKPKPTLEPPGAKPSPGPASAKPTPEPASVKPRPTPEPASVKPRSVTEPLPPPVFDGIAPPGTFKRRP
jgi:serine/threonine-protein kinase